MKICGVVNEYNEAKEIEDIVKVFVIEKRIYDITNFSKEKDSHDNISEISNLEKDDHKISSKKTEIIINENNKPDSSPIFNARGFS